MKPRRAIPLATRYAVLCNQADPEIVEKINRAGGVLKLRYVKVLAVAKCRMTGESLLAGRTEFDHILPRELGGSDDADNLQALTAAAHRRKTDADIARIAKAARQKRHHETGRSSGKKLWKKLFSRGFDRTYSKKLDGTVVKR